MRTSLSSPTRCLPAIIFRSILLHKRGLWSGQGSQKSVSEASCRDASRLRDGKPELRIRYGLTIPSPHLTDFHGDAESKIEAVIASLLIDSGPARP
jgi:hypothetical protein